MPATDGLSLAQGPPTAPGDAERVRSTVTIAPGAFLDLVNGKLRARVAMHDGRLRFGGDIEVAVSASDALGIAP